MLRSETTGSEIKKPALGGGERRERRKQGPWLLKEKRMGSNQNIKVSHKMYLFTTLEGEKHRLAHTL